VGKNKALQVPLVPGEEFSTAPLFNFFFYFLPIKPADINSPVLILWGL
jgi:hypothetical protein